MWGSKDRDCQAVQAELVAYLDGELSSADGAVVEGHLSKCDACEAFRSQVRQVNALVGAALGASAPADSLREPSVPAERFAALWERVAADSSQRAPLEGAGVGPGQVVSMERGQRRRKLGTTASRIVLIGGGLAMAASLLLVLQLQTSDRSRNPQDAAVPGGSVKAGRATNGKVESRAVARIRQRVLGNKSPEAGALADARQAPTANQRAGGAAAEVAGRDDLDLPDEIRLRAKFFAELGIVRKIDRLDALDRVLAAPEPEGTKAIDNDDS